MATLPAYAELHCLSNFSFLRGASHAQELIDRAAQLGYGALALTDECSLAGVVRAHVAAKELDFKLILGSEFRVSGDRPFKLVVLATNREGYGNLSDFITQLRRSSEKGTWVRLLDIPVEGMLKGKRKGIDVGDEVTVELISVDVNLGFIDFKQVEDRIK